jgi:hypothetical protein
MSDDTNKATKSLGRSLWRTGPRRVNRVLDSWLFISVATRLIYLIRLYRSGLALSPPLSSLFLGSSHSSSHPSVAARLWLFHHKYFNLQYFRPENFHPQSSSPCLRQAVHIVTLQHCCKSKLWSQCLKRTRSCLQQNLRLHQLFRPHSYFFCVGVQALVCPRDLNDSKHRADNAKFHRHYSTNTERTNIPLQIWHYVGNNGDKTANKHSWGTTRVISASI